MVTPIVMPKFGQMTEDSAIVEWLKKEGDTVAKGDVLFLVETDKSVMEVESFSEGTLLKIVVGVGVSVPVQSVVAYLGAKGEAIPATPAAARPAPASAPPAAKPAKPAARGTAPIAAALAPAVAPAAPSPAAPARFRISPRAAALAKDSVIDPHAIVGSGPEGRIVEKDVKAYLEANDYASLRVSPAAKALAAKEGLDLIALRADNAGKRIEVADVERAVAEKPKAMSKMRQVIAQRLAQSVVTAPHFYVTVEVDMTEALAHRARLNGAGARYSVTDFIAQASVLALKEFPAVNSATDGKTIRWHSRVHLGIAVNLDQGLVVPVVRDADEMTMAELSAGAKQLVDKARAGGLAPDEMSGSTFTISNMGMLDVENFTAIINPGESAILAVSSTVKKPVVRDDAIVARPIMKMTLSSDHRLIDGATATRFVNSIKTKLEDNGLWSALTS
ncbi:MAG: dihydrolipoamide acetyltransferase family protein [Roseiarcus sp.]|jgi:pyruvate dehydrogenase E2 component (dihydrolipoamide acetyltransferase)